MIPKAVPTSLSELQTLPAKVKGTDPWGNAWLMGLGVWLGKWSQILIPLALVLLHFTNAPWWTFAVSLPCVILPATLATNFMTQFHTIQNGVIWLLSSVDLRTEEGKRTLARIQPHEGVHYWQEEQDSRHRWKYGANPIPTYRRHAEAMAYALDVVEGRRSTEDAARSMAKFIYFMFLTEKQCEKWIAAYADKWRSDCEDCQ